jgi:3',5'-nucleoside bisphosphate phosphatase
VIDLHLHTTASDGALTPEALVARAAAAGLTTIAVADHDTGAAIPEMRRCAQAAGLGFVPGIEITSIWQGSDVHMLAYFIDPGLPRVAEFLAQQKRDRERRARLIGHRLTALGLPVDVERVIEDARPYTVSRPLIARAMVAAGHARSQRAAFDMFLAEGGPAYVTRLGATPADVVALVTAAGGAASMAHPGVTAKDDLIPVLAGCGLTALEVFHSDHTPDDLERYRACAERYGLAMTGGSDYHGTSECRRVLGESHLPAEHFAEFCRRAGQADVGAGFSRPGTRHESLNTSG